MAKATAIYKRILKECEKNKIFIENEGLSEDSKAIILAGCIIAESISNSGELEDQGENT